MQKRDRAWRRAQTRRVQINRWRGFYYRQGKKQTTRDLAWRLTRPGYCSPDMFDIMYSPAFFGRLKKFNLSCSCKLCKPQKYWPSKNKSPAERREKLRRKNWD